MAGGSYIDPHNRGESCGSHTENIAIICSPGSNCFGEPVLDIVKRACRDIKDYGDSIKSRENTSGLELLKQSKPHTGTEEEQRDAECKLLAHSLWLVDHETLLDDSLGVPLAYQVRNLPDESCVFTWISEGNADSQRVKKNIQSQYTNVQIAQSSDRIEELVRGYLEFRVNPNGSEQTVIEWSHEAADKIDAIRI